MRKVNKRERRRRPGIRLATLRGKLPAALLDDGAKPFTQPQLMELFGDPLEADTLNWLEVVADRGGWK